jgi:pyruvate dehydrogenase E2 component (dihydrolipoamide acetyltransferase)
MAETITMPKLGFDMAEGTLVRWVKKEGEEIRKGDVLAEIETDKATVEVESSASGTVRKLLVDEGTAVPVGDPIAMVGSPDEKIESMPTPEPESKTEKTAPAPAESGPATAKPEPVTAEPAVTTPTGRVKASPLARRMAEEKGLALANLQGSGPGGRIVKRDVESAISAQPTAVSSATTAPAQAAPQAGAALAPLPSINAEPRQDQRVNLTKLRQAIGRRMVESKQQFPHFYVAHEYKMGQLMALRKQVNQYLPDGEKLSVNDFIVKAAGLALRQYPNLNARLDGEAVLRFGAVNVGVAVTVPGGLLTVVVRDADQKPLRQISLEIKSMAARARDGKVKPDDVEGSTFSTSNLGMYDVENFIAIISPPEAAILALGSAREVPVVQDGEVVPGWRMKATISVDHRVSDGAEAAQFMQALATYLEEPLRLMV